MRVVAEESGDGDLTVKALAEILQGLPDNAGLTIIARDDQRDGKLWSVRAVWDSEADGMGIVNLRGRDHIGASVRKLDEQRAKRIHPSYGQFNEPAPPPWQE